MQIQPQTIGQLTAMHLPAALGHWSLADEMLCNKHQVYCMELVIV